MTYIYFKEDTSGINGIDNGKHPINEKRNSEFDYHVNSLFR